MSLEEEKNLYPKFIPQLPWPRPNVMPREPQKPNIENIRWKTSNILTHYYKMTREIRKALQDFMDTKAIKINDLVKNESIITSQNIFLKGNDKGRLFGNEKTKDFDHYHLNVKIGKKYNVSDNAVKKWLIKYNIDKHNMAL